MTIGAHDNRYIRRCGYSIVCTSRGSCALDSDTFQRIEWRILLKTHAGWSTTRSGDHCVIRVLTQPCKHADESRPHSVDSDSQRFEGSVALGGNCSRKLRNSSPQPQKFRRVNAGFYIVLDTRYRFTGCTSTSTATSTSTWYSTRHRRGTHIGGDVTAAATPARRPRRAVAPRVVSCSGTHGIWWWYTWY